MLTECASVLLIICVCGAVAIVGNRFGWWANIIVCTVGAVLMTCLFSLATTLPDPAKALVLVAFTALLWWVGNERSEFVLRQAQEPAVGERSRTYANEQPAIDDIFDFQEVIQ